MEKLYLQNRWKLEANKLVYYGMRKQPYLLQNEVRISKKQIEIIDMLLDGKSVSNLNKIKKITEQGIIVHAKDLRKTPESLESAVFCTSCSANDFIIPGIEFSDQGQCPMCTSKEETKEFKSVIPIIDEISKSNKSRFDVAIFYTGGKDSSFLLYYLSKVKNLRVLALTWDIPFMSNSAKQSLENAKKKLDNVEFVVRTVAKNDLRKIYQKLYTLNDNTCACPSLAYILFYPLLVSEKVPYFILGNEPVQMKNLYYNNMAPPISYRFANNKFQNGLINLSRIITFRKPFKKGQFQTLATMKQLAYGDNFIKKLLGYENQFINNVIHSIHEVDTILKPLKKAIKSSSITGNIPAFVHVDFDDISEGKIYDWKKIKNLIIDEVGWVSPPDINKGLHTSCNIEKCKEYTQFKRFYYMKSTMIPFSAIELSLASRDKNITKEQAIEELKSSLGLSLQEPVECQMMTDYIN